MRSPAPHRCGSRPPSGGRHRRWRARGMLTVSGRIPAVPPVPGPPAPSDTLRRGQSVTLQQEVRVTVPLGIIVRGNGRPRHCGPRSPAGGPGPQPTGRGRAAAIDATGPARPSEHPPSGTGSDQAVFLRASLPCSRKKYRSRHRVLWRCQPYQTRSSQSLKPSSCLPSWKQVSIARRMHVRRTKQAGMMRPGA